MNLVFFLLPFFCSASLLLPKNISSLNSTALISSLAVANPTNVLEVKRLIDDLIAAGEVDRDTATTDRNDAQVVKDDAGTALQTAKDQHTKTAGELADSQQEEARLTTLEDSKRVAKEAADDAKNAASAALTAAQDHLDTETLRLDEEKATLERILVMLDTILPTETHYVMHGRGNPSDVCEAVDGDCSTRLERNYQTHAIRCCSDTEVANFFKGNRPMDGCWGSSSFGRDARTQVTSYPSEGSPIQEGCVQGTWSQANEKCTSEGGRLCTRAELVGGCTQGTGCWFDYQPVWTSDRDLKYWAVGPIASTDVSDDSCGSDGVLAMPKTHEEQQNVLNVLPSLPSGGAYSGIYAWLGGKFDESSNSWKWNDGSPVGLPGTGETNWDNGEGQPGNGPRQNYLGLKRESGLWHDFHGDGVEINPGQIALCQG